MIIWRGFGILSPLLVIACMSAMMWLGGESSSETTIGALLAGAGMALGGILATALGWWLNVDRPKRLLDRYLETIHMQMWNRVQNGSFQMAPGAPAPRTREEAETQINQLIETERNSVARTLRNRHSFFFIPMHWLGILATVGGGVFAIAGVINGGL